MVKKCLRRIKCRIKVCVCCLWKSWSPCFHVFFFYSSRLAPLFLFSLFFWLLSVDQLGGNVYSFVLGITTIRVIRILLDCHLSLGSRYILYSGSTLLVCLAKIKFPKNNSDILVQRSSAFNRALSSIVHRSSQRECDISRFFHFSHFPFLPSLFHAKVYVVTVPLKTNFGPVAIISEKESGVPSETCSSFSIFPLCPFSSFFPFISCEMNESRIPSCEWCLSRGQCGSALLLFNAFCFVCVPLSHRRASKLNGAPRRSGSGGRIGQ